MSKNELSYFRTFCKEDMSQLDALWVDFYTINASSEVSEPKKDSHYHCLLCGGYKSLNEDSLPTCTNCGVVDTQYIDDSPEWVSGVSEDGNVSDPARCGMTQDTELFSASWGMGSIMKTSNHSSYQSKKLARINFHSSMNYRDRSLFHAYKDIEKVAKEVLQLPDPVIRDAKVIYKKFSGDVLTRGAVRVGIKANCVFFACKLNDIPRTTKEIADAFGIPTKDLSRTSDMLKETMGLKAKSPTVTKPEHVIHRMFQEIDGVMNQRKLKMKAIKLAKSLENCPSLMGKTPNSIAAVVIYKIFDLSKQETVLKCHISMPTLNKIEVLMNNYLEANNITI